jgi:hypothetical protein
MRVNIGAVGLAGIIKRIAKETIARLICAFQQVGFGGIPVGLGYINRNRVRLGISGTRYLIRPFELQSALCFPMKMSSLWQQLSAAFDFSPCLR